MNGYFPCELCDHTATERHHVFGGANRKHSEKYGLVAPLCFKCHKLAHGLMVNGQRPNGETEYLHKKYQAIFEETHTHEEFMKIFGKNYL